MVEAKKDIWGILITILASSVVVAVEIYWLSSKRRKENFGGEITILVSCVEI